MKTWRSIAKTWEVRKKIRHAGAVPWPGITSQSDLESVKVFQFLHLFGTGFEGKKLGPMAYLGGSPRLRFASN